MQPYSMPNRMAAALGGGMNEPYEELAWDHLAI